MMPVWIWAGASAVGTAHQESGAPCQDAVACHVWRQSSGAEVLIAALADGAGSTERADVGAKLATSTVVDVVRESLEAGAASALETVELIRFGAERARAVIATRAGDEDRDIGDFASTLLVAILHAGGGAVGQIGDGAVVAADAHQSWQPVLWPDHGEFINTTRFLTDGDALEHLRVEQLPPNIASVCLFSDGLERLVLDFRTRTAHGPFFDRLFRSFAGERGGHAFSISRELAALLASDIVNCRTDDDKSILCATLLRPDHGPQVAAQG